MSKELIIRSKSSSVDFALLKDGKLIEYQKEVGTNKFHVGDVFLGLAKKETCYKLKRQKKRYF